MQHGLPDSKPIDGLICAVLRGESRPWPQSAVGVEVFLRRSDYHGVAALLNEQLYRLERWPTSVLRAIHDRAIAQTVWELGHQQAVESVVDWPARYTL
jgi:hypothetical protein